MQTVEQLPALTQLDLPSDGPQRGPLTPRCRELACLHSSSLQHLSLQVLDGIAEGCSGKGYSQIMAHARLWMRVALLTSNLSPY